MAVSGTSPANAVTLLEREDAFATLHNAFRSVVDTGEGRLVLVRGEAGVGKTVLVERFCDEVGRNARVLTGACDPLFTPRPLGPIIDVALATGGALETVVTGPTTPYPVAIELMTELGSTTTVLILEDIQWGDGATLDVLRLVGRRLSQARTLVVATYRDDEVDRRHPLRTLLGELAANPGVTRLSLQPMSRETVERIATDHGRDGETLYRLTGGNPFFVLQVLEGGPGQIPTTVRDAVLSRVVRLSEPARDVLDLVALCVSETELWLIEAHGSLAALDECLEAGLLQSAHDAVAFRHELARRAVDESVGAGRRLELHRSVLATLEQTPETSSDLARLAHHAEGAHDAAAVLRYAPAAAQRAAALGAHRESAAQYARALRYSEALDDVTRAGMHTLHSLECYVIADEENGVASIDAAIEAYRRLGDEPRLAATLRWRALALLNWGLASEAHVAAQEAVAILERKPAGHELAMTYTVLASLATLDERPDAALEYATKAAAVAEQADSQEARIAALGSIGFAKGVRGSPDSWGHLESALALARELDLENLVGRTFVFMGIASVRERSLQRMRYCVSNGLAYCAERDLTAWDDVLLAMRAWLELEEGSWDDASETVAHVLARNCTLSSAQARIVLGLLRARRGDPDASTPLNEATAVAERTNQLWWTCQIAAANAEIACLEGRFRDVARLTDAAYEAAADRSASWPLAELGYWRWKAGIEENTSDAARGPFATQRRGDWGRAAEEWTAAGCPYEAALALADGDITAQRRALDELTRLGATPAARVVARRLRQEGARDLPATQRRSTQANAAGLTARESDVLQLLEEGLRNAEIAERLVVSRRTVDHHVSAILRKLDARTRSEAVSIARRRALLEDR